MCGGVTEECISGEFAGATSMYSTKPMSESCSRTVPRHTVVAESNSSFPRYCSGSAAVPLSMLVFEILTTAESMSTAAALLAWLPRSCSPDFRCQQQQLQCSLATIVPKRRTAIVVSLLLDAHILTPICWLGLRKTQNKIASVSKGPFGLRIIPVSRLFKLLLLCII